MKAYVKPTLLYENYELSQHIATCGIDMNYKEGECNGSLDSDFWGVEVTVFSDGMIDCSIDSRVIEAYCYTAGTTDAGRLFNS